MLKLAVLLFCIAVAQGAVFAKVFPVLRSEPLCLRIWRVNDFWQTPGKCEICICLPTGKIFCGGCPMSPAETRPCYRRVGTYPQCCMKVCSGDRDFDLRFFYFHGGRA